MLLKLIEQQYPLDTVVFYNTGVEFQAIYNVRDKAARLLRAKQISFVELHPDKPFLYSMLERKVASRRGGYHYGYGWCGGVCRWGTREKLTVINRYRRSLQDTIVEYVGIAADEIQRCEKERREGKRFPLIEWGMTEKDCLTYCYDHGWNWTEDGVDLYQVLGRVSCWCCRNKNLNELRNIYMYLPAYWDKLKEIQERLPEPMKSGGGIFDLERRFELEKEWASAGKKINTKAFYEALKNIGRGN